MMTAVVVFTAPAFTANVAEVKPDATVTVEGTVTALEFDDNATTIPPLGAVAEMITVPCAVPPEATDAAENVTLCTVGALLLWLVSSTGLCVVSPLEVALSALSPLAADWGTITLN